MATTKVPVVAAALATGAHAFIASKNLSMALSPTDRRAQNNRNANPRLQKYLVRGNPHQDLDIETAFPRHAPGKGPRAARSPAAVVDKARTLHCRRARRGVNGKHW